MDQGIPSKNFQKNPFTTLSVILLTDKQTNQPTQATTLPPQWK